MSEALPTDMSTLTDLMRKPIIIRIVSILDVTSLSILELLEYGLTLNDRIVRQDKQDRLKPECLMMLSLI